MFIQKTAYVIALCLQGRSPYVGEKLIRSVQCILNLLVGVGIAI